MKPVDQTLFGAPEGNCAAACIASVLELPLEAVPHFCRDYGEDEWWGVYIKWLEERGLSAICWERDLTEEIGQHLPGVSCIAAGPGPRGHIHAVVYRDGEMVHDPHPSRAGLLEITHTELIVLRDPNCMKGLKP